MPITTGVKNVKITFANGSPVTPLLREPKFEDMHSLLPVAFDVDLELASALDIARRARCTVHVRGTDKNPVIELKDKLTRAIVGGSELKRRLKDAL